MAEIFFKDPKDYILLEYELRRARRPSYSMRAFARDLNLSPSSLNDFMKSRVGMSVGRIEKIAQSLNWSDSRKEHFCDLILSKYDKDAGVRKASAMRVRARLKGDAQSQSLDTFKSISEWYHLVILEVCEIRDFVTPAGISKDLQIPVITATKAVKRLIKLGLLQETDRGLKPADSTNYYNSETPFEAIRSFHSQVLGLAQKSLEVQAQQDRESQSLVFSMDEKEASAMHAEIRKAVMNIVGRYADNSTKNSIQMLSLQVFPILQKETR